jgi:molybdate transport system substrate-binding protein
MRLFAFALVLLVPLAARAAELTVFAAASLTDVMKDIARVWEGEGHSKLRFSFDASSTLARQMEQGATVNLFASADQRWMDWAQQRNLIVPETRRTLLGNTLVLVMPKDRAQPVKIGPGFDLLSLLGADGRLAVGDPSNVPAGIYAKQALTKLGLWNSVEPRLARAENVRSALLLVERDEAPAGIVYKTDAAVSPGVTVVGSFPADTHDPIAYPFAVARSGDTPEARELLKFLSGRAASEAFARRGFEVESGDN